MTCSVAIKLLPSFFLQPNFRVSKFFVRKILSKFLNPLLIKQVQLVKQYHSRSDRFQVL